MAKPRVFVSSVIEEFSECRQAARRAIEAVGAEPVMAEDFAGSSSPRNACLDGVASSDVYLVIIGSRGGWTSPSGQLAVEEEYEEAKRRHLPVCVYLQQTSRDSDATKLAAKVGNYVSGHWRTNFATCRDLEGVIRDKLPELLQPLRLPAMDPADIARRLEESHQVQHETMMRLVIAPERFEEVIDRLEIGEKPFEEKVLRIAHDAGFFSYRLAKEVSLHRDTLAIEQASNQRRDIDRRMEIEPSATLAFDAVVSSHSDDPLSEGMGYMFVLVRDEVSSALSRAFTTAGKLFSEIDRYLRHQRFSYGVALTGIGFRDLADAIPHRSSFTMARNIEKTLVVERARTISRQVLEGPSGEVARIVTLLGRAINAEK